MIGDPTLVASRVIAALLLACVGAIGSALAADHPASQPTGARAAIIDFEDAPVPSEVEAPDFSLCATSNTPATVPATQVAAAQTRIDVQKAPERVILNGPLGTTSYQPADREKPFLEKTPANERAIGSIVEQTAYDLAAQKGKFVSWLGIVRSIQKHDGEYELLVEHKFFDGLTDLHILALSFNSAGDFKTIVRATDPGIRPLELVRVYGTVTNDKTPTVRAEYVRVFPWKTFTFIDCYGKDQGNPAWRKLCKAPLDRIYSPVPNEDYYRDRLGEPPADAKPQ